MLLSNGLTRLEVCIVDDSSESVDVNAARYEGAENTVLVIERAKFWRKYKDIFRKYNLRCQITSIMRSFFDVMKLGLWETHEILEDDGSREIFTESLNVRYKIKLAEVLYDFFDSNQYFAIPEMNIIDLDGVFIDCGAFVGDTVELFIQRGQGVLKKYTHSSHYPDSFTRCEDERDGWWMNGLWMRIRSFATVRALGVIQ